MELGDKKRGLFGVVGTWVQGLNLHFYPVNTWQALKPLYKSSKREIGAIIYPMIVSIQTSMW